MRPVASESIQIVYNSSSVPIVSRRTGVDTPIASFRPLQAVELALGELARFNLTGAM